MGAAAKPPIDPTGEIGGIGLMGELHECAPEACAQWPREISPRSDAASSRSTSGEAGVVAEAFS